MPVVTRTQKKQVVKLLEKKTQPKRAQSETTSQTQPAWFSMVYFGYLSKLFYNEIKGQCNTLENTSSFIELSEEYLGLEKCCKPSTLMNFIKESSKFDELRDEFTSMYDFARIFPLPSNGNCLFYGVYVYLRMIENNTPEIQEILGQSKGVFKLRNAAVEKLLNMGSEQSNSGITYEDILDGPTNFKKEVNKLKLNSMWDTEAGDLLPYAIAELTQKRIIILCEHGIEKIVPKKLTRKEKKSEPIKLVQYGGHYEIWFPK